jgi:hypothetical protein
MSNSDDVWMNALAWSVLLTIGIARLVSALNGWPRILPEAGERRAVLSRRLEHRLRRCLVAAILIAVAVAGLYRPSHLLVQGSLWGSIAAVVWGALAVFRYSYEREGKRQLVRAMYGAITASVLAASIAIVRAMLVHQPAVGVLLNVALLFIPIAVYWTIALAAEDVADLAIERAASRAV